MRKYILVNFSKQFSTKQRWDGVGSLMLPFNGYSIFFLFYACSGYRYHDIQHNDTQSYDTQPYDTQPYDTQQYDTQLNDTQHNDTQLNHTQHNDI
jgi:hypothetical protein